MNRFIVFTFIYIFSLNNVFGSTKIVFRYDDYGINNDKVSKDIFTFFFQNNIPLLIGVIPCHYEGGNRKLVLNNISVDNFFSSDLFTIGLHGCTHNSISNIKISEFEGVAKEKQFELISEGKEALHQIFNKEINVFIPPWNSYDTNTINVLIDNGFSVISARQNNISVNNYVFSKKIQYVPYTVTLADFINYSNTIINDANSLEDRVIVVMMHPYDFIEQNSQRGIISINNLSNLINRIQDNNNIKFESILNIVAKEQYDSERLIHNSFQRFSLPSFLTPIKLYFLPIKSNNYYQYLAYLYPILFYLVIFFSSYFISNYLYKKKLKIFQRKFYLWFLVLLTLSIGFVIILYKFKFMYFTLLLLSFSSLLSLLKTKKVVYAGE